jgi:hypothetical protein
LGSGLVAAEVAATRYQSFVFVVVSAIAAASHPLRTPRLASVEDNDCCRSAASHRFFLAPEAVLDFGRLDLGTWKVGRCILNACLHIFPAKRGGAQGFPRHIQFV